MAVEVLSFIPHEKNTLRGFATLRLTKAGLDIRSCCVHEKNGKRWVALPAKPYMDPAGKQQWEIMLQFDRDTNRIFQREAIKALDRFLAAGGRGL